MDISEPCACHGERPKLKGISHMHMRGLGQMEIASGIMSILGMMGRGMPNAGAGGSGGQPISVTVPTSVQTNVNPQISPVFVQQDSPQNSPVSSGITQASPSPQSSSNSFPTPFPATYGAGYPTPVTGAMPGFDTASGYLPTGTPFLPSAQSGGMGTGTVAAIGAGIVLFAVLLRGSRKGSGGKRRSRRR